MIDYKKQIEGLLLADLYDLCYRAHTGVSFSPEKRAVSYIKGYSEQLEEDLVKLGENQGNYKGKYIAKFSEWMSSKGNCISSVIAGPSNFPVRRAEKANRAEENAYQRFDKWREKYFKAVSRKPTPSPEEELDNAMKQLDALVIMQGLMKESNKYLRKKTTQKLDYNIKKKHLIEELGLRESTAIEALKGCTYTGKVGFPSYMLTNCNTTIKRKKEKVLIMKHRIETKENFEDIKFDGGYVTISDDRVKIFHDEKPTAEIRQAIKSSGFRWSPHWGCWCRKHTANALTVARGLITELKE